MAPEPETAEDFLATARAAEEKAAETSDPELRESFSQIARIYRSMAEKALAPPDEDDAHQF